MAATVNPTVSSYQLKSESVRSSGGGVSVTRRYVVPNAQWGAFESDFELGTAHPTYTTSVVIGIDKEPIDGEEGSTVLYKGTLTYGVPTASGTLGTKPPGTVQRAGSANAIEIPINRHPDWVVGWTTSKQGVEVYQSAQPTFTHTEIFRAQDFDFTEASLTEDMFKRASTDTLLEAGLSGASANKWLLVAREPVENGDVVELRRVWQYAENGWDTDIYGAE